MVNLKERLLAMKAVEKRFITEKQLKECLNTQEFFDSRPLPVIFVSKGYLTEAQIKRLVQVIEEETSDIAEKPVIESTNQKKRIGDMALEQNMVNDEQLSECVEEQEKYLARGVRVPLGQVMNKKGFITAAQVNRLLESQSKKSLYCKHCKTTVIIHGYVTGQIYVCETCKFDLIEAKIKKVKKSRKPAEEDGEDELPELQQLDL